MCRTLLHPLLAALPKVEHHMHLEGALSPSLLFTLAARNSITLPDPAIDAAFASPTSLLDRYTRFSSLDDFLHYYFIGMKCLIKEQDFEQLAWEYFLKAKSDGVVHAEVFFDPQAHTGRGITYETVVNGFTTACQRAERELELSTKLILCFLRHLPIEESKMTYAQARMDLETGRLAGLGLDSSENGFPPGAWKEIYETAKNKGIRRTAHAGEEGPVEYIREALSELDVERIDHGIRLAEDTSLMREVAQKRILVTMCPLSNVRLRCVKDVKELPIRTFLDSGVMFSINSDDPAYFGGYILDNYCAVQEAFNLTAREWEGIAKGAVECSWCNSGRKTHLLEQLNETMVRFGYG
ncbi:MAG: adenine deaminase [Alectoria sarmentosa]|nr:MAG: adenine deaminase [Alectoria sarmentosa]